LTADGARVTALDNLRDGSAANLTGPLAELVVGDVRHTADVTAVIERIRPRVVFHLAANASVPRSVDDPAYDFEANSAGTFVLLDALRRTGGCERVVLASSGAVYGQPTEFPIRETASLRPISPYGASKLNAEVTARMFWEVYRMPTVIARLFNAYGPRMARFVVLDFLRKLRKNPDELEILGDGRQVRDFTFVSDTVQGLRLLAERGEPGEAYNVSSGQSHSVTELAHRLLEVRGLAGRVRLRYTGSSWAGDAQRWEVDIARLVALGYRPQIDLTAGLAMTANWYDLHRPAAG
jgi:UDP-glucose 4-epimerase